MNQAHEKYVGDFVTLRDVQDENEWLRDIVNETDTTNIVLFDTDRMVYTEKSKNVYLRITWKWCSFKAYWTCD